MANNVVHFEIGMEDTDRAIKFYTDVFGWAFQRLGEQCRYAAKRPTRRWPLGLRT